MGNSGHNLQCIQYYRICSLPTRAYNVPDMGIASVGMPNQHKTLRNPINMHRMTRMYVISVVSGAINLSDWG